MALAVCPVAGGVGLDVVEGVVCDPGVFGEVLHLVAEGSCSDGDWGRME